MHGSIDRVVAWAVAHPWAITPDMLRIVGSVLARRVLEPAGAAPDVAALRAEAAPATATATGGVAVLPISGVLAPKINLISNFSGGATFDALTEDVNRLAADPGISTIILDFDSPGGSVAGAGEFAQAVANASAVKRVWSQANFQCCSAAYWAAARSAEIIAAPSALVGSIGVYCLHEDVSEYLKSEGVTVTYIAEGTFKVDGNPTEPLSDSARAHLQALVSEPYARFVADVAAGRGATSDAVRAGYGQGRALTAPDALRAGLIDRIDTLEATIARARALPPVLNITATDARQRRSAEALAIEREIAALGIFV